MSSFIPLLKLDSADVYYLLAKNRTEVNTSYEVAKGFTRQLEFALESSIALGKTAGLARIRDSAVLLFSDNGQSNSAAEYLEKKGILERSGDLSAKAVRAAMADLHDALDYSLIVSKVEEGFKLHNQKQTVSSKFSITVDFDTGHKFNALGCAGSGHGVGAAAYSEDDRAVVPLDVLPITTAKRKYEMRPERIPQNLASVKWLGANKLNHDAGLPRSTGIITLNERNTGLPIAMMRADTISAARTGAYAALAYKYLGYDDMTVGVLGSGAMAESTLKSLDTLDSVDSVQVWSRTPKHAKEFVNYVDENCQITPYASTSLESTCRTSDLLIGATSSMSRLTEYEWIKNVKLFVEINGREHPYEAFLNADKVVCDDWAHVKHRNSQNLAFAYFERLGESGFAQRRWEERNLHANFGEIVEGQKPGRESIDEKIYSLYVGLGDLDHIIATEVYNRARDNGIGQWVHV